MCMNLFWFFYVSFETKYALKLRMKYFQKFYSFFFSFPNNIWNALVYREFQILSNEVPQDKLSILIHKMLKIFDKLYSSFWKEKLFRFYFPLTYQEIYSSIMFIYLENFISNKPISIFCLLKLYYNFSDICF